MKRTTLRNMKCGIIMTVVILMTSAVPVTASSRAQRYSDWSAPINLGPTVNSTSMDRGPAISKDGLSLYFASTRLGGFGGEDIYVSQRETRDDEWSQPVNLGPIINTSANEMVPAFSRDGHLLFFASNRPGGFGGLDIWVSRREHTHNDFAWQTAENLGAGVNSTSIDAGPSYFDNDEGGVPQLYFNSNRPGGPGISNIYVSEQAADGSFGAAFLVLELSSLGTPHVPQFVMTAGKYSLIQIAQVLLIPSTCGSRRGKPCSTHGQNRST